MKSVVLLTAMLSGLCAEVMAAPIDVPSSPSALADPDDIFTHSIIERDLAFHAASAPESLFDDDEDTDGWDLNFEVAVSDEESATSGNGSSGSFRAPEPPLFAAVAAAASCLGIFALCRRTRGKRRSLRRRRVVRMRAIMAER